MSFLFTREHNFPREAITKCTIIVFNELKRYNFKNDEFFVKGNENFRPTMLFVYQHKCKI